MGGGQGNFVGFGGIIEVMDVLSSFVVDGGLGNNRSASSSSLARAYASSRVGGLNIFTPICKFLFKPSKKQLSTYFGHNFKSPKIQVKDS